MPKTDKDEVTLTAINDAPSDAPAAPPGVLATIGDAARKLEAEGNHTAAGLLHNLAIRFGDLKQHIRDVVDHLEGDMAALVKSIHDDL
ncbi:MAG: hypothetical protein ACXU85_01770 [Xanthobacteraceae bacterium]